MRLGALFGSLWVVATIIMATPACGLLEADDTNEEKLCTPGAYVFCRCADRSPGTKLCRGDAKSFEPCTTNESGECVGGEIEDPDTNKPIPTDEDPDPNNDPPTTPTSAVNSCPGQPVTVPSTGEKKIEGDTKGATDDRKGKQGACAGGIGAKDHVYVLTPQGSGRLEVKVQGSGGFDPIVYLQSECGEAGSQVSCGPSSPQKVSQFSTNVLNGRQYYLVVDGASGTTGKYTATLKLTTGPFCGDGKVDPGEACDDMNKTPDDGCENDCRRINGNPPSGGSCPGHPVTVWENQTVTGTGSNGTYGNAWTAPNALCSPTVSNEYSDHVYEVTPQKSGNMVVSLAAPPGGELPTLMLSARRTCTDAADATAAMCKGGAGAKSITFPVTAGKKVYVGVDGGAASNNEGDYVISFKIQQ